MLYWPGSQAEAVEFAAAALNNCECDQLSNKVCATHKAMKTDQRFLNDQVFIRRQRDRLQAEEFAEEKNADN